MLAPCSVRAAALLTLVACTWGCATAIPSPLEPQRQGTLGSPNYGLIIGTPPAQSVPGVFEFLRHNDRHHALPRFAKALVRAAERVQREIPNTPALIVGDFSTQYGGQTFPHHSHRNGLDVDLLFYLTTLDGAPVQTTEFVHFRDDGIGYSPKQKRWLRFDERRQWLLLRALIEDPEARVQWVFFQHQLEPLLLDYAIAHGEPDEIIVRAAQLLLEPHPGGAHDDHFHVRTTCNADEQAAGCVPNGPIRPWIAAGDVRPAASEPNTHALVRELLAWTP